MGRHKKSLEDAIKNITSGTILDNIVKQTTKDVAKKVKKDMKEKAKEAVKHYYESYRPDWYDRIYSLYHSYIIIDETKDNRVRVSVEFDPTLIHGQHKSDSRYHQSGNPWQKIDWPKEIPKGDAYGIPDADWILNNFWEGLHPIATGNKYIGFIFNPKKDDKSPKDLFDEFINGGYINNELVPYANNMLTNRVLDSLRKQFK